MKFEEMKTRIKDAAKALDINIDKNTFGRLEDFINAYNPQFPTDSVTLRDAATIIFNNGTFPGAEEKVILDKYLDDAEFTHGDRSWKYDAEGVLHFRFSPKHSGAHYHIQFISGEKRFPLCFPLTIEGIRYADMDDLDNHGDECPTQLDMAHPNWADDCGCEPEIEMEVEEVLKNSKSLEENLAEILHDIHYQE